MKLLTLGYLFYFKKIEFYVSCHILVESLFVTSSQKNSSMELLQKVGGILKRPKDMCDEFKPVPGFQRMTSVV